MILFYIKMGFYMNNFKILIFSLCCALFTYSFPAAWATETSLKVESTEDASPSWEEVVDYAREHFAMEGILMIKTDGFAYLKVDDEYIHTLFPMLGLTEDGFKEPPYFRSKEAPGAHISVFYESENIVPEEIGQSFPFELKQIVIVRPSRTTSYAVLQVESPELEKLRQKYGRSAKLFGHEYHISIGKKTIPKKAK
jgi:hypothetical protein